MSFSDESSSQESARNALNTAEERIAAAVVDALKPQLANIDVRLDGVDKQLTTLTALVVANHEDITSVADKLAAFQEESAKSWEANRQVMNQLVNDVTFLMDR